MSDASEYLRQLPLSWACADDACFLPVRSRFGRAFEEAAEKSKAKAQQRYFDASVVEVRRDDFDKFLKDLSMG